MTSFDTGTKNLPYRQGFPTPAALPDSTACRVFRIPADDTNGTWQATFMGLLMYLSDPENWVQQSDGLDAETCAARWLEMIDNAYDTAGFGCSVTFPAPDDEQVPVFRVNASTGHLEQLDEQQNWVDPQGAYAVPEVPAREGTEVDAKCLAAANCANVLETLYETIVDGIAGELTDAEILEAIITTFVTLVGWGAAAGILFSLGFIGLVVIGAVIAIVALLASDVWDENFTDALRCVLYNCAAYDAGVVTFDYDCVVNALAAQTDLTLDQLRLFGQMVFIINAVGGADGLNQAGATTEITVADCSACNPTACQDFSETGMYSFPDPSVVSPSLDIALSTTDTGFGNPAPSIHAGQGDDAGTPACAVYVEVDLGANTTVNTTSFDVLATRDDGSDNVYFQVDWFDASHVNLLSQNQTLPSANAGWLNSGDYLTGGISGVRFVRIFVGMEGAGSYDAWIDNVCWS